MSEPTDLRRMMGIEEPKFTPGEWELFVNSNGVWWIEDEEGFIICEGDVYMSEVLLIAASKKMYEALKAARASYYGDMEYNEAMAIVDSALDAVEGKVEDE